MSPNRAIPSDRSKLCSPLAAAQPDRSLVVSGHFTPGAPGMPAGWPSGCNARTPCLEPLRLPSIVPQVEPLAPNPSLLIKKKSTASGGETIKGSAVSGIHQGHRDLGHMNGTSFGRRLWDCGTRVSMPSLDEYPSRRCIHEQAKLQRDEDQGGSNFDSTQRPLQGAFLIPPVLPVVLIYNLLTGSSTGFPKPSAHSQAGLSRG